jgi:hypothetical protein
MNNVLSWENQQQIRTQITRATVEAAKAVEISLDANELIYSSQPGLVVVNTPIAGLSKVPLRDLLSGTPILFCYFSDMQLLDGTQIPAGFYTVRPYLDRGVAALVDAQGTTIVEAEAEANISPVGNVAAAVDISNVDVNGSKSSKGTTVEVSGKIKADLPVLGRVEIGIHVKVTVQ